MNSSNYSVQAVPIEEVIQQKQSFDKLLQRLIKPSEEEIESVLAEHEILLYLKIINVRTGRMPVPQEDSQEDLQDLK